MKKVFVLAFLCLSSYSFADVEFLKYYFSVLGIRAGEATVNIKITDTNIFILSKVKTYPGLRLFVNVDDTVKSYIDKESLKTLKRDTLSVGQSLMDTNVVIFDRKNGDVFIDSVLFGKLYIYNTNDSINDLATEILRATKWNSLPTEISLNFLEITNTRFITLQKQKGNRFLVQQIKDAYIEMTNINNTFIFYKANIPVFYLFPFGNISLYVELSEVKFSAGK